MNKSQKYSPRCRWRESARVIGSKHPASNFTGCKHGDTKIGISCFIPEAIINYRRRKN